MHKTPLKLKIELQDVPHEVMRQVLVPDNITLAQFHWVLQCAMGWVNRHIYEFADKRDFIEGKGKAQIRVGIPNDMDADYVEMGYGKLRDSKPTKLKETFYKENKAKPFWYIYDMGDYWEHKITPQKVSQKERDYFYGDPLYIEAAGKCPPDDVGGSGGYTNFLDIIHDKNHPEFEETVLWAGISPICYDVSHVNLNDVNMKLAALTYSGWPNQNNP